MTDISQHSAIRLQIERNLCLTKFNSAIDHKLTHSWATTTRHAEIQNIVR